MMGGQRRETEDPLTGSRGAGIGKEYHVSTEDTEINDAAEEGGCRENTTHE